MNAFTGTEYNTRNDWAAFNGLYQKAVKTALPPNRPRRGKRELGKLSKRIGRAWKRIETDHPNNYLELNHDAAQAADDPAKAYEERLSAEVKALAALNDLARVEGRVGRAADIIWTHTQREIARLKMDIEATGNRVGSARQDEEYDQFGSYIRRDMFQANSQPTPVPGGRQWHGHLGHGTFSHVGLCLSGNAHNQIVDRLVMKDVWFTSYPDLWTDMAFWMGDALDPTSKVPVEVHIMGFLTATGQENILRMKGWPMAPEKLMYRIYMQYSPDGDADNLLDYHRAASVNQQQNICIPEPAIWHIFNSLIKAGLTMENLFINDDDHVDAQVVHLDLGDYPPDNPDHAPSSFAMYPTCKVGDFGISTYRHLAKRRPQAYIGRGTGGFYAPEQKVEYHGQERPHLNTKTNVWGVGITVMALMNLDTAAGALQFREAAMDETDPLLVPDFTPAAIAGYSAQLRHLVRFCVQYNQDDRPEFSKLFANVRQCTVPTPGLRDYALGARFATRDALPAGLTLLSGLPANNYTLGMAMPP